LSHYRPNEPATRPKQCVWCGGWINPRYRWAKRSFFCATRITEPGTGRRLPGCAAESLKYRKAPPEIRAEAQRKAQIRYQERTRQKSEAAHQRWLDRQPSQPSSPSSNGSPSTT